MHISVAKCDHNQPCDIHKYKSSDNLFGNPSVVKVLIYTRRRLYFCHADAALHEFQYVGCEIQDSQLMYHGTRAAHCCLAKYYHATRRSIVHVSPKTTNLRYY